MCASKQSTSHQEESLDTLWVKSPSVTIVREDKAFEDALQPSTFPINAHAVEVMHTGRTKIRKKQFSFSRLLQHWVLTSGADVCTMLVSASFSTHIVLVYTPLSAH